MFRNGPNAVDDKFRDIPAVVAGHSHVLQHRGKLGVEYGRFTDLP